jgi:hypothetical protein
MNQRALVHTVHPDPTGSEVEKGESADLCNWQESLKGLQGRVHSSQLPHEPVVINILDSMAELQSNLRVMPSRSSGVYLEALLLLLWDIEIFQKDLEIQRIFDVFCLHERDEILEVPFEAPPSLGISEDYTQVFGCFKQYWVCTQYEAGDLDSCHDRSVSSNGAKIERT